MAGVLMLRLSVPSRLKPIYFWLALLTLFAVLGLGMNAPIGGVIRDTRDSATIVLAIVVGYFLGDYRSIRTALLLVLISCVVILALEWTCTPEKFWRAAGFLDYQTQVFKVAGAATSDGSFEGYYDESNIGTMFKNYDSFNGDEVENFRYGGIIGNPIVFGHFFSALTCFFFYDWKVRKGKGSALAFLTCAFFGSHC